MMSHRNWHSVYQNMLIDRGIDHGAKLAHIGPLTHASGTYFIPYLLRGAASVIVANGPLDIFLSMIEREKITAFTCVPTVLTRILNHENLEKYDLSSLRWIGFGGEAIPRNTLKKALAKWGSILTQNYGLTEAMMTCSFMSGSEYLVTEANEKSGIREGCIGRPYTFVELVIRDEDGSRVAIGEVGEITISAEHVMQGYWRRPDETAHVLRDGWLWSGDLARQDDEGYVYLVGRSKEMFISGGFNIYPAEVESCLSGCPGVQAAAVIGVPDESLGELCVAFIAAEPGFGLTETMCEHHCKPIIGFRTPRKWFFVDHLPLTGNGKVDKASLKASLESQEMGQ
jgi:acyl-CoA synthetase (AMP-forming)/AMP-acid ligase II